MISILLLLSLALSLIISAECQGSPLSSPSYVQGGGGLGDWQLLQENIGISAMHMQLLHNNKVVMFDRTDFGTSNISLPGGQCRNDLSDTVLQTDCTAHSIIYDIATNSFRPLMITTDTWCSSGAVQPDGMLVQTGGFNDGDHVVRTFTPCDNNNCDWIEYPNYLSERRWYATNQILPDGRIIVIGGRRVFNYEFFPKTSDPFSTSQNYWLNFLLETRDYEENNLYPFVHLLPDGNLFIFANTRAIALDYVGNTVVREFPPLTDGGPRNYPSSGSSVMLPIDENQPIAVEIVLCGGSKRGAFTQAAVNRVFVRASSTCARIKVTDANPNWVIEDMPIPRIMGDMLMLPDGNVLIINGAELGTAGWENAANPVTTPVLYKPKNENERFHVMSPSPRPRMYHSSAILLTDGRVLVGGSNPHIYYNFTNVEFPTDLTLEAYSPPYLSTEFGPMRPNIIYGEQTVTYNQPFSVTFNLQQFDADDGVSVNIIAPSFTTHSFAMNQRMVVLKMMSSITQVSLGMYNVGLLGPSNARIAPPGYYLLFVVHDGIPSPGLWVKVQ